MTSRLLAGSLLIASSAIAWLTITFTLAARVLQAGVALSMVYVGYLAWRGWRTMRTALDEPHPPVRAGQPRPWVTVVVPARNEATVIADVVGDLARQGYADASGPRYDVLIVDDGSSDGTGELARAAAPGGERVRVIRREQLIGPRTKGAVLNAAHPWLRGDVIATVDADARLDPDFLERAMSAWERDPKAAALQSQRRVLNRGGWLAAAQDEEQLMDMASQCGRWATDGTAELRGNGMFVRRPALEAIGGWNERAITEDLDLATRLVAAGEHVALAPEAEVREEAVTQIVPLWRQRMRWAEGSLRRLMEVGPGLVLKRRLPFSRRLDFLLFVGEFLLPPLFVTTIIASLITIPLPRPADWTVPASLVIGYGLGTFLLAFAGLEAHGVRGPALFGRALRGALFLSHWLVIVPAALIRITLWPRTTAFAQTPRAGRSGA